MFATQRGGPSHAWPGGASGRDCIMLQRGKLGPDLQGNALLLGPKCAPKLAVWSPPAKAFADPMLEPHP